VMSETSSFSWAGRAKRRRRGWERMGVVWANCSCGCGWESSQKVEAAAGGKQSERWRDANRVVFMRFVCGRKSLGPRSCPTPQLRGRVGIEVPYSIHYQCPGLFLCVPLASTRFYTCVCTRRRYHS